MFPETTEDRVHDALQDATAAGFWLNKIQGFPIVEYLEQVSKAEERYKWYSGRALEAVDKNRNPLYPAQINPIKGTVQKHAWALFGQVTDSTPALVVPKFAKPPKDKKPLASHAEDVLLKFWEENHGRGYQLEGGLMAEIFKGTYYKLRWTEDDPDHTVPVALDRVLPFEVIGYMSPSNPWRMDEAWVVRKMTPAEARKYIPKSDHPLGHIPTVASDFYIEHWLPDSVTIWANDQIVTFKETRFDKSSHPFGIVPIFYAPHIRAGDIHGENTFDHLINLVKEINLMIGHVGDAISVQSHDLIAAINSDNPTFKKIRNGLEILLLGSTRKFDTVKGDPDLKSVKRELVTAAMLDHIEALYKQYRRDGYHPAVIDGEDEGSQRSSATLLVRLLALISHVDLERVSLGECLNEVNKAVLRLLAKLDSNGINKEHLNLRMYQKFAPSLPKDREAFVREMTQRRSSQLGTLEHLLGQFDDIEDPDQMAAEIEAGEARKALVKNIPKNGGPPSQKQPVGLNGNENENQL